MISLIIPVYNCKNYLNICVESIFAQKYNNWEIILIDDGSTDGSSSICDMLSQKDKRINVIHTKNCGVSNARNTGLEIASGEHIMFVDSDDYLNPDYLISFVIHSNADLVVGGYRTFGLVNKHLTLDEEYVDLKNNWGVIDVNTNNPRINAIYHICGKLYKASIVKGNSIRFPKNMKLAEDTCFNIEYLQYCKDICFVSESGYNYRMNNFINKYKFNIAEYHRHVKSFMSCCEEFYHNTGYHFSYINNSILMSFLIALNNDAAQNSTYKEFVKLSSLDLAKSLLLMNVGIIQNTRERTIYCAYRNPIWGYYYIKFDRWLYSMYMLIKFRFHM